MVGISRALLRQDSPLPSLSITPCPSIRYRRVKLDVFEWSQSITTGRARPLVTCLRTGLSGRTDAQKIALVMRLVGSGRSQIE